MPRWLSGIVKRSRRYGPAIAEHMAEVARKRTRLDSEKIIGTDGKAWLDGRIAELMGEDHSRKFVKTKIAEKLALLRNDCEKRFGPKKVKLIRRAKGYRTRPYLKDLNNGYGFYVLGIVGGGNAILWFEHYNDERGKRSLVISYAFVDNFSYIMSILRPS